MFLIFGHADVFAWPMRPLAKMARHISAGEVAFFPLHWNGLRVAKSRCRLHRFGRFVGGVVPSSRARDEPRAIC
jgi:hypothetical protein